MRIGLYTKRFSAHQLTFARRLMNEVGAENFRYVWKDPVNADRQAIGWKQPADVSGGQLDAAGEDWVENCEVLYCGYRVWKLWERRSSKGLKTFYVGERWMEPWDVPVPKAWLRCDSWWFNWSGWLRWLRPSFRKLVRATVRLAKEDPNFQVLAIGPWARLDFIRLGVPERKIGCWEYEVESQDDARGDAEAQGGRRRTGGELRVVWVGRMIRWKHPETVVRAVRLLRSGGRKVSLTMIGDGPLRTKLEKTAEGDGVRFLGILPQERIRETMRDYDVLVMSSDGNEGWGVVVGEAQAEGLSVVGTWEAGCVEKIPEPHRFHAGDVRSLAGILARMQGPVRVVHAIAGVADRSSGIVRNTLALDAALRAAGAESRICTDRRELARIVDAGTVLHVHNSWLPIVLATAGIRRRTGCRLVVSPRGSMSAWALGKGKWKKRLAWWFGMRRVWKLADVFVATSEKERDEISARQRGLGMERPVEVVRLGCEFGQVRPRQNPQGRELHVLCLGRVEPVKGLDRLLDQLKGVKDVRLRIAGPSIGGYGESLRGRGEAEFVGEIHGEAKEAAFDWADVLTLPSWTENFGSVIVEALSRGVPVVASRGTPWSEVETVGCGWWTDDFRAAAEAAKTADLVSMGQRGSAWVRAEFVWENCAVRLKAIYRQG